MFQIEGFAHPWTTVRSCKPPGTAMDTLEISQNIYTFHLLERMKSYLICVIRVTI